MNIGFSTGFLRPDSLEAIVEVCSKADIRLLELWEHDGFFAAVAEPQAVRQRFEEEKITVSSVHAPFPDGALLARADKERYLLGFEKACHNGNIYKASYVVFHPAVFEGEIYLKLEELQSLERTISLWKEAAGIAAASGLRTAFENLPRCRAWPEGLTPMMIADLIKSAGIENSGICLDISHTFALNISEYTYDLLPGLNLLGVHVSDGILGNCKDRHLPPGEGDFDWERFNSVISKYHPSVPLVIEVNSPYLDGALIGKISRFLSGEKSL